ncbi:hypothetical protein B0H11DRAFT_2194075 [Mycena galericulata]|nr:hypothetical protein B0H11DRAFT_2194075 [Mycena galericulata]
MSDTLSLQLECLEITQNPPLVSEIATARDRVVKGRQKLAELKTQIASLVVQQKELEEYIDNHQRIVFSINRFPPELLSLIFFFSIPTPEEMAVPLNTRSHSPWLVSQCIHIPNPDHVRPPPREIWQRGPPPLSSRTISCAAPSAQHSNRWSSLLLSFNWVPIQHHLAAVKGNVDQLEELYIEGVWGDRPMAFPEGARLTAFAIAPRLSTLSVSRVCEPAVSLVLPWHQLREYCGVGMAYEHLAVLQLCPNLTSLDLTVQSDAAIADNAAVSVCMPRLQILHLVHAQFLRLLSLPMLEEITLEKMPPDDDALLPLLALTRRDRPPLTCISLLQSALITPTLVSLLEENPVIDTLHIQFRRYDGAAVDALISHLTRNPAHGNKPSGGGDNLCFAPNLTRLVLAGRGAINEVGLFDMLDSRYDREPDSGSGLPAESDGSEGSEPHSSRDARKCECQLLQDVMLRLTHKATLSAETVQRLCRWAAAARRPPIFQVSSLTGHSPVKTGTAGNPSHVRAWIDTSVYE